MQYLYRRGAVYHFYRRVPQSLVPHYGKVHIRHSLHTKDIYEAKRRRNLILVQQDQEFSALLSANAFPADKPLPPYSARNADITANDSITIASRVNAQPNHLDSVEYSLRSQNEARERDEDALAQTLCMPGGKIHSNQRKRTTLSQLIDEHRREHTNKLAKPATVAEYESVYALLLSILLPHAIVANIDRQQARKVKNILEYLTPNHSKTKETKGRTPVTVAAIVKAKDLPLPKPATVNKKLTFINAIFNYALDEEWIQTNPFRRLSVKDTQRAKDKRQPFTEAELKLLVGRLQVDSGSGQGGALNYWTTLIALYQGMCIFRSNVTAHSV